MRIKSVKLFLPLLLVLTVSCMDYDFQGDITQEANVKMCVVGRQMGSVCLITDGGEMLLPSVSLDSTDYSVGDRFRVTYLLLNEVPSKKTTGVGSLVQITDMQPALVKDVQRTWDSTFNGTQTGDLIWLLRDPWFGGGFLNLEFAFWSSRSSLKHDINLHLDSIGDKTVFMTFFHDANYDQPLVETGALASFRLKGQSFLAGKDSLVVRVFENAAPALKKTYFLAVKDTLS